MNFTSFEFESKIFNVEDAYFYLGGSDKKVLYHLDLGDVTASLEPDSVMREFGIPKGSNDAELIELVKKSLKFVPSISPGDKIPTEIIDGTASWPITDSHKKAAYDLVMMRLAQWVRGDTEAHIDHFTLAAEIEKEENKSAIQEGFKRAADALGLKDKDRVVQMLEKLANELAYIEALRDYYHPIFKIKKDLQEARSAMTGDREGQESIVRIQNLLKKPLTKYQNYFDTIYGQVTEIMGALQNLPSVIDFVREGRDSLHSATLTWNETYELLLTASPGEQEQARHFVNSLYRFTASNFLERKVWL